VRPPRRIDAARFFEFIRDSELAVVFVSVHRLHAFNREVSRLLASEHKAIATGTLRLGALLRSNPSILRFLHQGLRHCGAPSGFGVLPGYYLFRRGEMLAWDSGLPALDDIAALARGALLGAVWSGLSSDLSFIQQAVHTAADQAAAERVTLRFRQAIAGAESRREASRDRDPEPPPQDELFWAYQVLRVLPTATDREVHNAWRRRRAESHPDHVAGDPIEFERRSRVSRDINHARDVIVKHRYPGTRGATHAWAS
jgi:hypothetical protein